MCAGNGYARRSDGVRELSTRVGQRTCQPASHPAAQPSPAQAQAQACQTYEQRIDSTNERPTTARKSWQPRCTITGRSAQHSRFILLLFASDVTRAVAVGPPSETVGLRKGKRSGNLELDAAVLPQYRTRAPASEPSMTPSEAAQNVGVGGAGRLRFDCARHDSPEDGLHRETRTSRRASSKAPPQTAGPEALTGSVVSGTGRASVSPTIGRVRHFLPHVVACCRRCWLAAPSISGGCALVAVRSGPKFSPSNVTHAARRGIHLAWGNREDALAGR